MRSFVVAHNLRNVPLEQLDEFDTIAVDKGNYY